MMQLYKYYVSNSLAAIKIWLKFTCFILLNLNSKIFWVDKIFAISNSAAKDPSPDNSSSIMFLSC